MPRGDGTGPRGFGPMTGRGLGYCQGPVRSRFYGPRRKGRGYGYRYQEYGSFEGNYDDSVKTNKEILIERKKFLEEELKHIEKILKEEK